MKKDKEWLKEEINKEVKNIDYPLRYSTNEYNVRMSMIEAFKEKVDQLNEPEITEEQALTKTIKRDDVLDRLQEIGEHNRNEWIEVILRVFGNDYGTAKYREGYEQGVLNGILTSNKKELVEVPQFVADWYEKNKDILEDNIDALVRNSRNGDERRPIVKWMLNKTNKPIETLIRMKDGYTIEPPKTLQVIVKNYDSTVYKTELPEDEAMKLIEGWKENE